MSGERHDTGVYRGDSTHCVPPYPGALPGVLYPAGADVDLVVRAVARARYLRAYPADLEGADGYAERVAADPPFRAEMTAALAALAGAGRMMPVDAETAHLVELRAEGWTVQHPLSCRPNLFACEVNRVAERGLTAVPDELGVFECRAEDGVLVIGAAR
ncbi:DUF6085 family protein [Micromonospora sp. WMMD1082]|uniref:DUF6085 family protein n=1 Tax=Micromonospora sp. WMMD1082 TaxID=3016104 RepID=UPI002416D617|nr:DUF6085 family protein [Micromonospora sp. WMMD1082]MDG4796890.1 DUF6085 family protein [Micromonospora sp. WMMD1082]